MKKIPLILLAATLAVPQFAWAQTTVFNDTFISSALSTLNGTSTPGGTATASTTSYDVASTKTGSCAITAGSPGFLRAKLSSGTTAGYGELQSIFTSTPVQLVNIGDSITLTIAFTNSANTLLAGGNGSVLCAGLYYSGSPSALPVAGSLNGAGLGNITTFVTGNCQNWQGYVSQLSSNTLASKVYTRTNQTAANNANQDLLFSGSGTGLYNTPGGAQLGVNFTGGPTLANNAKYTMAFTILLAAAGQVAVTNSLFDANGNLLCTYGGTSAGGASYINNGNYFDGLGIGFANKGTSLNPTLDISQITITKNTYTAPAISGLTNQIVIAGKNAVLGSSVTGNPSPALQWYVSTDGGMTSNSIPGATRSSLTLTNVQYSQNNYQYSLVAANSVGTNASTMTLSVIVTPSITGLYNQAVYVGNTATITPASVSGVPTPTCQWQFGGANLTDGLDANGSTITGSQTSSLSIANAQAADSGTYSLVASNSAGVVTNSMYLLVSSSDVAPTLVGPTNITVIQGNNGTLSISSYYGLPQPTLQWLDPTQTPITAANNTTFTLTNVQYSQNGSVYYCVASNTVGSVTNSAVLTVIVSPSISSQPTNLTVINPQSASFSVTATGVPAVTYQWYRNGSPISPVSNSSATNATLVLSSTSPSDAGSTYYVQISNAAGTTNSASATLTVNSSMSATTFSPANGASGLCYDTPLTVAFSSTISLGTNGTIKIYNVTNSATPVDTIDVSLGAVQQRTFPGDGQSFSYQTISISGSAATIYPHFNVMSSNATYYVTIDNACFKDSAGANFAGITATNVWQFSTKIGGPVDANNPVVKSDGTADFLTVQGAVNSIPAGTSATQRVINIRNGIYTEIVDVAGKHNVTFRGQSRAGAVVAYPNNATFQAVNGGTTHARMTFKVNANDIVLDTMTVSNSTPQGGSQAEALMIESSAKRCIVYNSEIDSRQDTILANVNSSQAYFYKSIVKGNFDYIWGGGNLYFDQCTIQTIAGASGFNLTAARTDTATTTSTNFPWANPGGTFTANGMSFVNCTFTADSGVGTVTLAGSNGTAGNNVSWYGCDFATNYIAPSASLFSGSFIFWQDLNTMTNAPVTFAVVTSISGNDARLLAATNLPTWFYGWQPQLAPNILTNPSSQSVTAGQPAVFNVSATGIPDPTYQWQHAGTNLPGARTATFNIPSAQRSDGGNYSVVANNSSGSVTSLVATLTYNNTAPVAGPNFTMGALLAAPSIAQIVGGKYPPTDVDNDALTVTSVNGATNGTVSTDGTNATYTATNGTTDSFTYTVSDGYGGTASATVTVFINSNVQGYNQLSLVSLGSGTNVLTFAGIPTYNYALDMATNLLPPIHWMPQDTNPAANNGTLIYTNVSTAPQSYYRTRYVP